MIARNGCLGHACSISAATAGLTSAIEFARQKYRIKTYVRNTNNCEEDADGKVPTAEARRSPENLHDGDTVAFEGFTHLIPTAAAHEAIRQGFRDLTLVRMTPDLDLRPDGRHGHGEEARLLLCRQSGRRAAAPAARRGRERLAACRSRSRSTSHAAMANAYEAAPPGCPARSSAAIAARGWREVNPNIRSVDLPLHRRGAGGRPVGPARRHLHPCAEGQPRGDVLVEGIVGIQKEAVLAAKRAVVTVEEVVDDFDGLHPNADRPARLDRRPRSRSCPAARIRPTRTAITTATTPPISNGTRSPPTATVSRTWMEENVMSRRRRISPAASRI